ncbi:hypothetical protein [Helicobacter felis]|uniref:hypothetical protein n=1 Tax=Helicobacter felis TaxID=214 RepID=UPI0013152B53|nr:hypothetical protein [Helicobacter felis]
MDANRIYNDMARYCKNALNRTITKTARKQREMVREQYALPHKKLRRYTKIRRARTDYLEAIIRTGTGGFSLDNFKRRQTRTGVVVKLSKSRQIFMQGAFLAAPKGGVAQKRAGWLYSRNLISYAGIKSWRGNLTSYVHQRGPKATPVYSYSTEPYSQIVKRLNARLLPEAHRIFAQELARE